jgi:glycosyltransferase involved in cell wall biosynthesis
MNIGVAGYINPTEFKEYLPNDAPIFTDNQCATAVNTLVKEFLRLGHNVYVFSSCSQGKDEYHFVGERLQIHMVGTERPIRFTSLFSQIYMTKRIKRLISTYVDELDVLHAHWTYYYALASKSFSDKVPVCCTVRDWTPYIYSTMKGFEARFGWWIRLQVFKRVMSGDAVNLIANSDYTLAQIHSKYPKKNVSLIYNPVDRAFILDRKKNDVSAPTFITISQSIDDKRKNILTLVMAFSKYRQADNSARLIIVGRYKQDSAVISYIKANAIDGIEITGQISHDEVIKKIDESTCLVHPAIEETFGNILLEAMARCVPCIGGNNSGGVPIVLGNGKYGSVCDITDSNAILSEMKRYDNLDYTSKVVSESSQMLKHTFSSDAVASKHINLFKQLIIEHHVKNN